MRTSVPPPPKSEQTSTSTTPQSTIFSATSSSTPTTAPSSAQPSGVAGNVQLPPTERGGDVSSTPPTRHSQDGIIPSSSIGHVYTPARGPFQYPDPSFLSLQSAPATVPDFDHHLYPSIPSSGLYSHQQFEPHQYQLSAGHNTGYSLPQESQLASPFHLPPPLDDRCPPQLIIPELDSYARGPFSAPPSLQSPPVFSEEEAERRSVTPQGMYRCECGMVLSETGRAKNHRTHEKSKGHRKRMGLGPLEGEKVVCEGCGKVLSRSDSAIRHMKKCKRFLALGIPIPVNKPTPKKRRSASQSTRNSDCHSTMGEAETHSTAAELPETHTSRRTRSIRGSLRRQQHNQEPSGFDPTFLAEDSSVLPTSAYGVGSMAPAQPHFMTPPSDAASGAQSGSGSRMPLLRVGRGRSATTSGATSALMAGRFAGAGFDRSGFPYPMQRPSRPMQLVDPSSTSGIVGNPLAPYASQPSYNFPVSHITANDPRSPPLNLAQQQLHPDFLTANALSRLNYNPRQDSTPPYAPMGLAAATLLPESSQFTMPASQYTQSHFSGAGASASRNAVDSTQPFDQAPYSGVAQEELWGYTQADVQESHNARRGSETSQASSTDASMSSYTSHASDQSVTEDNVQSFSNIQPRRRGIPGHTGVRASASTPPMATVVRSSISVPSLRHQHLPMFQSGPSIAHGPSTWPSTPHGIAASDLSSMTATSSHADYGTGMRRDYGNRSYGSSWEGSMPISQEDPSAPRETATIPISDSETASANILAVPMAQASAGSDTMIQGRSSETSLPPLDECELGHLKGIEGDYLAGTGEQGQYLSSETTETSGNAQTAQSSVDVHRAPPQPLISTSNYSPENVSRVQPNHQSQQSHRQSDFPTFNDYQSVSSLPVDSLTSHHQGGASSPRRTSALFSSALQDSYSDMEYIRRGFMDQF